MGNERTVVGLVLAKIEGTYGTDPTPTAGANTIAVRRNSVKFGPKFQHIMREILDGSMGAVQGLNSLAEVEFSFSVEVRGNRTDGTAPDISAGSNAHPVEIDCLLQSCDLNPTYTAESVSLARDGYVTYVPTVPTDQGKSCTFYFFTGLKKHIVTGCKGTLKITMQAGQMATIDFTFKGFYTAPTDVAIGSLSPTFLNTVPPLFQNSGSSIGSFSPVFSKLDFDLGLSIQKREDANSVNGVAGFIATDRKPKITVDPESVAEATATLWADLAANTSRTITAKIGTVTGNKVQLTCVGVPSGVQYGDRSGIRTQPISYSIERALIGDTPGNEVQLKFF